MGNEGYLQTKVRNLNQEIESLESRFGNLKIETKKLEEKEKQIDAKIELIKSIEQNMMSKDIVRLQEELYEKIVSKLKELMQNQIGKGYISLQDRLIDKINKETYPYLDGEIKEFAQKIVNLQIGIFNKMIIPVLNKNQKIKILPLEEDINLMFSEKEVHKFMRRKDMKTSQKTANGK